MKLEIKNKRLKMGKFPGFGNLWAGDFFYWKYMGNFVGKFLIITP